MKGSNYQTLQLTVSPLKCLLYDQDGNNLMSRQREQQARKSAPDQKQARPSDAGFAGSRKRHLKTIYKDVNTQQELTVEALLVCKQLVLNPQTLKLKTYEDFVEPGLAPTV